MLLPVVDSTLAFDLELNGEVDPKQGVSRGCWGGGGGSRLGVGCVGGVPCFFFLSISGTPSPLTPKKKGGFPHPQDPPWMSAIFCLLLMVVLAPSSNFSGASEPTPPPQPRGGGSVPRGPGAEKTTKAVTARQIELKIPKKTEGFSPGAAPPAPGIPVLRIDCAIFATTQLLETSFCIKGNPHFLATPQLYQKLQGVQVGCPLTKRHSTP